MLKERISNSNSYTCALGFDQLIEFSADLNLYICIAKKVFLKIICRLNISMYVQFNLWSRCVEGWPVPSASGLGCYPEEPSMERYLHSGVRVRHCSGSRGMYHSVLVMLPAVSIFSVILAFSHSFIGLACCFLIPH